MNEMLNKTEWVEREYSKFVSEYEVEPIDEFKVNTMFKLMYEYNYEIKDEHVKTRKELLEMIHRIQSTLRLEKKIKESEDKKHILFLTKDSKELKELFWSMSRIVGEKNTLKMRMFNSIETFDTIISFLKSKDLYGKRLDHVIDMTNSEIKSVFKVNCDGTLTAVGDIEFNQREN